MMSEYKTDRQGASCTATFFTHRYPDEMADAVERVIAEAGKLGARLLVSPEETEKYKLSGRKESHLVIDSDLDEDLDVCLAMGGDGTILYALRRFIDRDVPVFGVNYGRVGFLATVGRDDLGKGLELALTGRFETLKLPALLLKTENTEAYAVNDVAFLREPDHRVADLTYSLGGERVGDVRCDGLVVATPAGSTGYNLANGGPVLAWGVEGYVISFVAPHTLNARPLLAAASDRLTVRNEARFESVAVSIDGRTTCELGPGAEAQVSFDNDRTLLAQLPGTNFYHQFREKFGRL